MKTEENKTSLLEVAYHADKHAELKENNQGDYSTFLNARGVKYREDGNYLLVGVDPNPSDRVFYLSCIVHQIPDLLDTLIPLIYFENLGIVIPKNKQIAKHVLNGSLGYENIGKVMMIFIAPDKNIDSIVQQLIELTNIYNGPKVPMHKYLGGLLHIEFSKDELLNNDGNKPPKSFKQKYIVLSNLKADAKGDVYRCFYLSRFLSIKSCVIKEGKRFMVSDDSGKDMTDRLKWQQKIHLDLYNIINVPKVVELFEDNGDTYLVMEFIGGYPMNKVIEEIYRSKSWLQLITKDKAKILNLILEVLTIVETFHNHGYIHRDLTPANFLLTKNRGLYLIDWEMAFNTRMNYPFPVFGIGTTGFMSPEQISEKRPTIKEDVYAIGVLLTLFFTNLPALKFDFESTDKLKDCILFFTKNNHIASTICKCVSPNPDIRPEIIEIKKLIDDQLNNIAKSSISDIQFDKNITKKNVNNLTKLAFEGLTIPELIKNDELFYQKGSFDHRVSKRTANEPTSGILSPIAGIIYTIFLDKSNNCTNETFEFFKTYLSEHKDYLLNNDEEKYLGLFYGTAGKALTIHYGILSGLIPSNPDNYGIINNCFKLTCESMFLKDGVAGQLLALVAIQESSQSDLLKIQAKDFCNILLKKQNRDGSWSINKNLNETSTSLTGIVDGVSGVVLSLLYYVKWKPDETVNQAIFKALNWLKRNISYKEKLNNNGIPSLINDFPGIALVFLYAYESYKIEDHKIMAETILAKLIRFQVHGDFSMATGITGIGLVYAEAARICGNNEWRDRAVWIFKILEHMAHKKPDIKLTWNINGLNEYDASLLTGTSGIILFIMKIKQLCT